MSEERNLSAGTMTAAQAAELAQLVDLEARWENMRADAAPAGGQPSIQGLQGKQKAYDAFRSKLAEYNKRFAPTYAAEQLLNTPVRLGRWCAAMRDLYSQLERESRAQCPTHVLEKAYRWADRLADKMGTARFARSAQPATLRAAAQEFDSIGQWCGNMGSLAPAA